MITKLVTERGTSTIKVPKVYAIWSGPSFLEYQKKKMAALPERYALTTKRGTSNLKMTDYSTVEKIPTRGLVISTARGTATRILYFLTPNFFFECPLFV